MSTGEKINNEKNKTQTIVIIILLLLVFILLITTLYYFRLSIPSNPQGLETDLINPFCLRMVCGSGSEPTYKSVESDPQQDTWVTLNFCTNNAPSTGMIEALRECGIDANSEAGIYFHSSNKDDPRLTNIEVYRKWYTERFQPNCGFGWIPIPGNREPNDNIVNLIDMCIANRT